MRNLVNFFPKLFVVIDRCSPIFANKSASKGGLQIYYVQNELSSFGTRPEEILPVLFFWNLFQGISQALHFNFHLDRPQGATPKTSFESDLNQELSFDFSNDIDLFLVIFLKWKATTVLRTIYLHRKHKMIKNIGPSSHEK